MKTGFKVHVHRAAMASGDPRMWYVHIDSWGAEPRGFHDIKVNVPCTTFYSKEASCGCANAWMAGEIDDDLITYDDKVLNLG